MGHCLFTNEEAVRSDEVVLEGDCSADLTLKWMTEVGSSIYATPLITDLYSDGHKDIIVPSFVHYLEVRTYSWACLSPQKSSSIFPGDIGMKFKTSPS